MVVAAGDGHERGGSVAIRGGQGPKGHQGARISVCSSQGGSDAGPEGEPLGEVQDRANEPLAVQQEHRGNAYEPSQRNGNDGLRGYEADARPGENHEREQIAQALREDGWAVTVGERFRLESPPGIRVTISTLLPEHAPQFAQSLAKILGV